MRTKRLPFIVALLPIIAVFAVSQAQTNATAVIVDKVVAHPDKYKGKIDVAGRIAKIDSDKKLFVLGCEDACVAMPVKFSGTLPKAGSDVIVRGEIKKESDGRYLFNAESVTAKK